MDIKIDKHTVIVFDLDDTLYNEIDYLKSAYRDISVQIDPDNSKNLYREMFAMYRMGKDVFQYLSDSYGVKKQDLVQLYRNHKPNITLFEGVLDLFKAILKKEGRIALITDGRVKTQSAKLEALGITNYLSKTVISEAIGSEKPNERNFKLVEDALSAKQYYYIADNIKKDFVTPNSLGWKTIGLIDNGQNIHVALASQVSENYLPHNFIASFKEVNII
ncbi:HAD family hydrolase [Winogradskyella tangerina]|uniref:HAD family hydrolase n=1 Tax=Winogradskyella tangerina TaxID=2023240 RepID=UPI000DBE486D|nr:HAD family hydrolase [Winogradskyella tangerina]